MRKIYLLAAISAGFTFNQANAQLAYQTTYGTATGTDQSFMIVQNPDSTYALSGQSNSFSGFSGDNDFYLIVTDVYGAIQWDNAYGGSSEDISYSLTNTSDNGYVMCGTTNSFLGNYDGYYIKVNGTGAVQWSRTTGGIGYEDLRDVKQSSDGGYIMTGQTQSVGAGGADAVLYKADANGNQIWERTYGGTGMDFGYGVVESSNGGFVLSGSTSSFGAGAEDFYVIRTNTAGDTLWTRTYGGGLTDVANDIDQMSDGGYIIAGYTASFGAGANDFFVVRTDSVGDTLWTRAYGGPMDDQATAIRATSDGGCVVSGHSLSFSTTQAVYVLRLDSLGDTLWTRTFDDGTGSQGNGMVATSDDGFAIAATRTQINGNAYFLKLWGNGWGATCNEDTAGATVITNTNPTVGGGAIVGVGNTTAFPASILTVGGSTEDLECTNCVVTIQTNNSSVPCFGDTVNGAIDITISSGTAGFAYLWSTGATTEDISGLPAASYSVTVTDTNGCVSSEVIQITQPPLLQSDINGIDVSCNGESSGQCNLAHWGGTPGYTYLWSTGATTQDLFNVTPGTYTVTVTDTMGCTSVSQSTIGEPSTQLTVQALSNQTICFTGCANLSANAAGGTGVNYIYTWSHGIGNGAAQSVCPFETTSYVVTATDENGCTATDQVTITVEACPGMDDLANAGVHVHLFPNPNSGRFTMEVTLNNANEATLEIFSVQGKRVMSEQLNGTGTFTRRIDLTDLSKGVYYVKVATEEGIYTKKVIFE